MCHSSDRNCLHSRAQEVFKKTTTIQNLSLSLSCSSTFQRDTSVFWSVWVFVVVSLWSLLSSVVQFYLRTPGVASLYPLQCCCSSIQTQAAVRHQQGSPQNHLHSSDWTNLWLSPPLLSIFCTALGSFPLSPCQVEGRDEQVDGWRCDGRLCCCLCLSQMLGQSQARSENTLLKSVFKCASLVGAWLNCVSAACVCVCMCGGEWQPNYRFSS